MKLFLSAYKLSANESLKVVPVTGEKGLFSFENAYSGEYEYFRTASEKTTSSSNENDDSHRKTAE